MPQNCLILSKIRSIRLRYIVVPDQGRQRAPCGWPSAKFGPKSSTLLPPIKEHSCPRPCRQTGCRIRPSRGESVGIFRVSRLCAPQAEVDRAAFGMEKRGFARKATAGSPKPPCFQSPFRWPHVVAHGRRRMREPGQTRAFAIARSDCSRWPADDTRHNLGQGRVYSEAPDMPFDRPDGQPNAACWAIAAK